MSAVAKRSGLRISRAKNETTISITRFNSLNPIAGDRRRGHCDGTYLTGNPRPVCVDLLRSSRGQCLLSHTQGGNFPFKLIKS